MRFQYKQQLATAINKILNTSLTEASFVLPPSVEMGELSFPCFELAKVAKKSPAAIATEFAEQLNAEKNDLWLEARSVGPYLNLFLNLKEWNRAVVEESLKAADLIFPGEKERIMIEFSQANTHKEFHIGHLRNACLGAALVNLNRFLGNKVFATNYPGDTGVHVAKCLWYLQKFNEKLIVPENLTKGQYLGQAYAAACNKLDENPGWQSEVSEIQKKIETASDKGLVKLWQKTKKWSLEDFDRIYKILNTKFDKWYFESEEEKAGRKMIEDVLKNKKIPEIQASQGAIIADLRAYNLEVLVLVKSDGNLLYGAKDLPLGIKKFEEFKLDKSIYVVDNRQSLYLKQVFKLLDLFGFAEKKKIHVSYDFVTLKGGAMASRKGNVVTFDDLFDSARVKIEKETAARHEDWPAKKISAVAEKVALAAVKFYLLKYDNDSVIVFDLDTALALDGATGSYLLYTLARINSLLKKARKEESIKYQSIKGLETKSEKELLRELSRFADVVERAAATAEPANLCLYLLELAQAFNSFYHTNQVLGAATPELVSARLALVRAVEAVLNQGLKLLNIEAVAEM
jgi:arginyl-tRNA synthetase